MNGRLTMKGCVVLLMACVLPILGAGCQTTRQAKVQSAKPAADKEKELKEFYAKVNQEFEEVTFEIDDRRYSRLEIRYQLSLAGNKSPEGVIRGEPEFELQAAFARYRVADYGWEYIGTIQPEPLRFRLTDLKEVTSYDRGYVEFCFNHPVATFALNRSEFVIVSENSRALRLWMPGLSAETQARLESMRGFLSHAIEKAQQLGGWKDGSGR